MWFRVLVSYSLCSLVSAQNNHVNSQDGAKWGWQTSQSGPGTFGHYFVKLPESEQQVRYIADGSGYHSALAVVTNDGHHSHTANFALGQRAIDLTQQAPSLIYQNLNATQSFNIQEEQNPVEIYLLQQQYAAPSNQIIHQVPFVPNNLEYSDTTDIFPDSIRNPFYYNILLQHTKQNQQEKKEQTENLQTNQENNVKVGRNENTPIVQVFKDQNCLNDNPKHTVYESNLRKAPDVTADIQTFKNHNVHGDFGARETNKPVTHTTDSPRSNARSEKYYYSTEIYPSTTVRNIAFTEDEGISKLVASTQDLISNEDLIRINHAVEKFSSIANDDYIKPHRPPVTRSDKRGRNKFVVSTKFGNIFGDEGKLENSDGLQTSANSYKFISPIVVDDPNYNNYKEQIVNNLMSTMTPYIQDGYEIVGVKNTFSENYTNSNGNYNSNDNLVAITPRPIGQNYLAPITVALRLLNSNASHIFNTVDDHEVADSEFISKVVSNPQNQKVIVEIQKSIPMDITHINEIEYHEYLDEGRSNTESPLGLVKTLYQKYMASLDSSNDNNRDNQNKESETSSSNSDYENTDNEDSKEAIESSENIRSEVHVQATDKNNGYDNYYNDNKGKIIQPIVIEKQVPVTTYVDRFIEKQVPYPEPYEVVKHVPVDRPVPVPVHYEKIVEKPVEVTRYVDKPYPVEILKPFPVEVRVPYPVERKVYVDRPVHVPYPVEKVIEKQFVHPVPIPTPVAVPIGIEVPVEKKVLYPIGIDRPVHIPVPYEKQVPVERVVEKEVRVPYPVEKKVPYPVPHEVQVPVPYPVEKRVPVPVEKIIEKPVTVTKVVEKPVHIKVPQPVPVEVPRPYPVDRIVEKKVPYPVHVEHVVEKKVPVQVPYPVKTVVEKIVDKPVYVTKYIDRPFPVEKRVPYPVEKIIEKRIPFPVEVPIEIRVPYPVEKKVIKPDLPYEFEKIDPSAYLDGYGSNQAYQVQNVKIKEQYKKTPSYDQSQESQQAESQRNYQLANANSVKNIQIPVHTTYWGNQYASTFQYVNPNDQKPNGVSNQNSQKYFGPPPLKNYEDQWNKNVESNERVRKSDRTPKVSNLRIEYGFKPPLIPSTEVDLDGLPVNKNES